MAKLKVKVERGRINLKPEICNGIAGLEAMEEYLQQAMYALDDVAGCFELLGLDDQAGELDLAQDKIQDTKDLIGVFLGKVEDRGAFDSVLKYRYGKAFKKPFKKLLKKPSKAKARKKVKVAA